MKHIYIFLIITITLLSSCQEFLEEDNRSQADADEFYRTPTGFNSLVASNYQQLTNIYGGEAYIFCSGTDMYEEGRDSEPVGLARYTQLTPSSSGGIRELYQACFTAIEYANTAIHYSKLTEQTSNLDQLVGEVRYLRANAYFLLVQTYGGVTLKTEYTPNPVLSYDRNSAEEIYTFIIQELEGALTQVEDATYSGRVTKRAVQHLLAKVHLTRGYETFAAADDYTKAYEYADAAISGQGLTIPFEELWAPDNQVTEEVLFSVRYNSGSVSADPSQLGNSQSSFFSSYQGGSEVAGDAPYRTYTLCPTQYTIDLFTENDERFYATFMLEVFDKYYDYYRTPSTDAYIAHYYVPQWVTQEELDAYILENTDPDPGKELVIHPYGSYVPAAGSSMDYQTILTKKFDDPTAPFSEDGSSTRDIILSRLGDTYLIAAEAYLMAGMPGIGLDRLNTVRQRAKVIDATLEEFDIDYILDERGRELFGEYHRWFDLKRTGKLVERAAAYNSFVEEANFSGANGFQKILRPIPQDAIDLNQNKDFPQNPAYN